MPIPPTKLSGKVRIDSESDIVTVRKVVRDVCRSIGFCDTDVTRVVTAASELARNVYRYAKKGEMHWEVLEQEGKAGLEMVFEDHGPGIKDIDLAMRPGYSTVRGLGLGLPGAKRLMDFMNISSQDGQGTRVTVCKWSNVRTVPFAATPGRTPTGSLT